MNIEGSFKVVKSIFRKSKFEISGTYQINTYLDGIYWTKK